MCHLQTGYVVYTTKNSSRPANRRAGGISVHSPSDPVPMSHSFCVSYMCCMCCQRTHQPVRWLSPQSERKSTRGSENKNKIVSWLSPSSWLSPASSNTPLSTSAAVSREHSLHDGGGSASTSRALSLRRLSSQANLSKIDEMGQDVENGGRRRSHSSRSRQRGSTPTQEKGLTMLEILRNRVGFESFIQHAVSELSGMTTEAFFCLLFAILFFPTIFFFCVWF